MRTNTNTNTNTSRSISRSGNKAKKLSRKEFWIRWITALSSRKLRSGKHIRKTEGVLAFKDKHGHESNCCLGVACRIIVEAGLAEEYLDSNDSADKPCSTAWKDNTIIGEGSHNALAEFIGLIGPGVPSSLRRELGSQSVPSLIATANDNERGWPIYLLIERVAPTAYRAELRAIAAKETQKRLDIRRRREAAKAESESESKSKSKSKAEAKVK